MNTPQKQTKNGKCPVAYALDIIGDRWSLLIIRDIVFKGKRHYGEFAASHEKISTNILADRLARLEAAGILTKSPDPKNRTKQRYGLTQKGLDLIPILLELTAWSAMHDPQSTGPHNIIHGAPPDLLERAKNDRVNLLQELAETNVGPDKTS